MKKETLQKIIGEIIGFIIILIFTGLILFFRFKSSKSKVKAIDVGKDFSERLGRINAKCFRKQYLSSLDNKEIWQNEDVEVILDFKNVRVITPSFVEESFGYFKRYVGSELILKKN